MTYQIEKGDIVEHKNGDRYTVAEIEGGEIVVEQVGDRLLDACPVEYGDDCPDPECDGRVGETERDPETMTAHELYCYGCGLNWVSRGGLWEEKYADWPTSFEFDDSADGGD